MSHIVLPTVAAIALSLSACAAVAPIPGTGGGSLPPTTMTCSPDAGAWAVGKQATAEVVERLRADTHSQIVRVVRPGEMITMEVNARRVDIRVDGNNVVLAVTCG